jgi:replicative superfamily II helicase
MRVRIREKADKCELSFIVESKKWYQLTWQYKQTFWLSQGNEEEAKQKAIDFAKRLLNATTFEVTND